MVHKITAILPNSNIEVPFQKGVWPNRWHTPYLESMLGLIVENKEGKHLRHVTYRNNDYMTIILVDEKNQELSL